MTQASRLKLKVRLKMAKTKNDIQPTNVSDKETNVKTKPKKTKNVETEKIDDVKVVENNIQVDVEIDLSSYNHSDVVGGYIRRKRLI